MVVQVVFGLTTTPVLQVKSHACFACNVYERAVFDCVCLVGQQMTQKHSLDVPRLLLLVCGSAFSPSDV